VAAGFFFVWGGGLAERNEESTKVGILHNRYNSVPTYGN